MSKNTGWSYIVIWKKNNNNFPFCFVFLGVCRKVKSGSRLQSCSNQVDIAIKEQNYLWYSCIYVPGGQPCDLKAGCKTKESLCVPFNFEL